MLKLGIGIDKTVKKIRFGDVTAYIIRVTADGGYYEAILCLELKLDQLR
jgi:hypothetical protein